MTTFAGGGVQTSGYGTNLSLANQVAITVDGSNNVWVLQNGALARIKPDASATNSYYIPITSPSGICADSRGQIYVSDGSANKIMRLTTNGVFEVFAGSGNYGGIDGNGIFCSFASPASLACDSADNVYVWETSGYRFRRINQNRDVQTIVPGPSGNADGLSPTFSVVNQMCFNSSGEMLIACGITVRKLLVTTNALTLAGALGQSGYTNGPFNVARFSDTYGIALARGQIFVADTSNQRIRTITNNSLAQLVPPSSLQLATYPGLTISGTVGRTYQIESSSNLSSWTYKDRIILNKSPFLWFDTSPVAGQRFYRVWMLP